MTDPVITTMLAELGFVSTTEAGRARAALEAAGLTHPGKQAISEAKLPRVRAVLADRFVFGCAACADALRAERPGAELLPAEDGRCERCGGSDGTRSK